MMQDGLLYDPFDGPDLDPDRWSIVETVLESGQVRRYEEPGAELIVQDGTVQLSVEKFQRSHDLVQIFDNPKHDFVSASEFEVADAGETAFTVEMSGENIGGDPEYYRDGFAACVVFDGATGWIFDHAVTSTRRFALIERLALPGSGVRPEDAFSWVVDSPFALPPADQREFHEYTTVLDRANRRVRWLVDDALVFEACEISVPKKVQLGFGLFTLQPLVGGRTQSIHGQGMIGRWRGFRVR